jgi:hypothetical protein
MLFKGLVKMRRRRNKENVVNFANDVSCMKFRKTLRLNLLKEYKKRHNDRKQRKIKTDDSF